MSRAPVRGNTLAAILLLRAAVHAGFAVWIVGSHPGWVDIFRVGSNFALVDGTLGLLGFVTLVRLAQPSGGGLLAAMNLADAVGRLTLGTALRVFPGLPLFARIFDCV